MIRIMTVDDGGEYDRRLRSELQKEDDMIVVGRASTYDRALHQASFADVVLIDATSNREKAVELIRGMRAEHPEVNVLVIGAGKRAQDILAFVEAGAVGYISTEDTAEQLLQKVRAAGNNETIVPPQVAAQLMSRLAELSHTHGGLQGTTGGHMRHFEELTPREWEVLGLVADGMSNQEIANQLYIARGTVKNHVHHILQKLSASNRHEAAAAYLWKLKHENSSRSLPM